MHPEQKDELLKPAEAAQMLKVSTDTLETWRAKRIGPAWTKLGDGKRSPVRYSRAAIREYLLSRRIQ